MDEKWTMPQLELGPFELGTDNTITTDDSYQAAIYFEDEFENYSIEIQCESADRIGAFIVRAVNNHDALIDALQKIASLEVTGGAASNLAERVLDAVSPQKEPS